MNKKVFFLFSLFSLVIPGTMLFAQVSADQSSFLRNLKLGDRGSDVKALQVFLNSDDRTVISPSGVGSRGEESDYFGQLTQKAVMKFQNLHSGEIFNKAGISTPTGFVGPATRDVLRILSGKQKTSPISTERDQTSKLSSAVTSSVFSTLTTKLTGTPILKGSSKTVNLYRVLPYQVVPKGVITLTGQYFDATNNTVYIGSNLVIPNVSSSNGSSLTVLLPDTLLPGKYEVWVQNNNGTSKNSDHPIRFIVTTSPVSPPIISSILPKSLSLRDKTFTVTGSGFTKTGNNVYSSIGTITNLPSSDGKTLVVNLADFQVLNKLKNADTQGLQTTVSILIQNENGAQETPFSLGLQL